MAIANLPVLFWTMIANLLLENCNNINRTINYNGVTVMCKVKKQGQISK
jgi:hypothetical protein